MQKMLPAIPCLGVQCNYSPLLPATLRQAKALFVQPVKGRHLNLAAVAQRGEVFQTKIDRDGWANLGGGFRDLNLDIEIPAPAGIFAKRGRLDLPVIGQPAAEPQAVSAPEQNDRSAIFINPEGARRVERNPAKVSLFARPPRGAMPNGVARNDKLPGDSTKRVAVNAEFGASSGHQADKIEPAGPPCRRTSTPPPLSFALDRTTEVPGVVNCAGHAPQVLGARLVFDTIAIGEDHLSNIAVNTNNSKKGALPHRPEGQDFRRGAPR